MRKKENSRLEEIYERLKNNSLMESEYQQFLQYMRDPDNKELLEKLLDEEARENYLNVSKKSVTSIWTGKIIRAASILILLGVIGVLLYYVTKDPGAQVYTTSNGEILEVFLPDSSYVKLNANSRLSWMSEQDGTREIKLIGEAYFRVRHVENAIFVVSTGNSKVKVLGTSFNVNSRSEEDRIFLEEGKIQLEKTVSSGLSRVFLEPGESAVVHRAKEEIEVSVSRKMEDEAAWKEGLLRFSDVKLGTIINRLEEIYGKDIRLKDSNVLEKEMEFTLPYSNWEVTGQALALAVGLQMTEKDGFIELK